MASSRLKSVNGLRDRGGPGRETSWWLIRVPWWLIRASWWLIRGSLAESEEESFSHSQYMSGFLKAPAGSRYAGPSGPVTETRPVLLRDWGRCYTPLLRTIGSCYFQSSLIQQAQGLAETVPFEELFLLWKLLQDCQESFAAESTNIAHCVSLRCSTSI